MRVLATRAVSIHLMNFRGCFIYSSEYSRFSEHQLNRTENGHMTVLTAPTQKQGQPEQSCDRQNSHVAIIGSI
jgi:hypothetical protein